MIRRHLGASFRLIRQTDHAALSGALAAALREPLTNEAVLGITLHDAGWSEHDDAPTLNNDGEPRDVFESTLALGLPIWGASAERAGEQHPYAGLLVSLHSLALAGHQLSADTERRTQFDWLTLTTRMAELQTQWREQLGMRVDRPTHHGLAAGWSDDREDTLRRDFRWLRAFDKISLDACRTDVAFGTIEVGPDMVLRVERPGDTDVKIGPWPFAEDALEFDVPYRAVPARRYATAGELHEALVDAPTETMRFSFRPLR
ncbi:MAG: DUF3891 family protein [Planctomycetota bacterium]